MMHNLQICLCAYGKYPVTVKAQICALTPKLNFAVGAQTKKALFAQVCKQRFFVKNKRFTLKFDYFLCFDLTFSHQTHQICTSS
jgi:hypothetical protein